MSCLCLQAWRHAISFPFRSSFLLRGGDGHDHPALIFIDTIHLAPLFILPDPSFGLGTPGPGGRDRSVFGQTGWQNLQEQRSPAVRVQPPSISLRNSNLRYLIVYSGYRCHHGALGKCVHCVPLEVRGIFSFFFTFFKVLNITTGAISYSRSLLMKTT